ncbi:uncharacterized protein [Henckelia pumila]|uniref:uncharacterized protein n=1 Tax=Henckelia pumila TaxID=405737 RepID=UPI003C6DD5AE
MNNKALNSIFTALDSNIFSLVTNCVCAKQVLEKLQMHCEGSDSVRRTKRRILTTQFENLRMEESETIDNYERRLRKIENEAIDLGDAISNERLVNKVLRSLPERFQMKICAIDESKDTSILRLDELMSSLRTYELEMNGVNESDLGDDSIAFLTKQFGTYLKRMRDSKKPGQKPKVLNTPAVGKPLRIGGPEQNTIPSKSQNRFQNEGKTLNNSKRFESVKCHECTGFGHFANECPTRLRKGMSAFLSNDEDEEGTEQGDDETHNALLVLVQQKNSVVTGVPILGHNTDQKLFCLNASVSGDSNQEAGEVELSWDNAQKMYEELYNDWIVRNKSNSALTKENRELKASVARLEVVLSKKDLELGKVKEELGRANATLAKFNSSKTKLDSILMMGKDDRAGLGFHNSKFEEGESSKTIFVKENNNFVKNPTVIPKEKPIPLKTQAPVQRKNQRKRRQELSSVLPTLNQNTARRKNTEKKDKGKVTYGGEANGKNVGKDTLNVEGLPKLHNNLCQVFDKSNSCVLIGTRSSDNCYQLGEEISCKFTKVDDLNLWHQKLGHANFKALKKLSKYEAVRGMPNLTSGVPYVCGDCQKDLMGPMEVESCGGKKYLFVCVDDFSRYSWVIRIRTDHGKEFENSLFEQFCEKEGISHEYSAPKTPQQNGIAERKNRTLQEMARVMLSSKNIAKRFWVEALNTACHISNRVMQLAKFDSKSDKCLFLGYALNSRAYRVFNLRTRTIIESINVIFDDYADLKGKTIEDHIDDLLDTVTP